ncbi:uncharacterized protein LOC131957867 [Physella acuta]|uniref:uncharacterized protein LOC131957867 n=1 Tax=Physella acuta TaxID=109671 RepID=UPI0027DE9543|nr:uncharacterized protein LOC131957867 [Physella acuta]
MSRISNSRVTYVIAAMFCLLALGVSGEDKEKKDEVDTGNRFVFPFYPKELDILIGHLQTKLYRITESMGTCQEINNGNHEAGSYFINVYDDGGADSPPNGRISKLEKIAKLREEVKAAELKLEKCRFQFWAGARK